ncbi:glycosyltransferase family 9 protein [Propionivibrio sp.]|uniref:glycosyltransferase family 9 protein n=1 Tax=Propionivibrio sp. TaxID=2212460 RepID=UPI003BF2F9D3
MKKFLVIRRDNIGDLVCTTPLIHALRKHFPDARIDALVNSYNQPVLAGNPDLDNVYAYTKAKHREGHETVLGVHLRRVQLMLALRRLRYDYVILANCGFHMRPLNLARWVGPQNFIGFVPQGKKVPAINTPVPIDNIARHEVENVFRLLAPLGITEPPPALQVHATPAEKKSALQALGINQDDLVKQTLVAIHISARKVLQRWPAERFTALMRLLHQKWNCRFILLWSPGDEKNPLHPGDDGKAASIIAATKDLPVLAYPTTDLGALIGALSICQAMVCSDGGAMHVGAGLGLPILCFFGNSDASKWYPWGVPNETLQKPSHNVIDISVEEAAEACDRLKLRAGF